MTNQEIADKLSSLVQLDIDAAHAYGQAIEKADAPEVREHLMRFRDDHNNHVHELSRIIREIGGMPPDYSWDFKGFLIEGFTALRSITGTDRALKAMKTNEELTTKTYREACALPLPPTIKAVVERNYGDEQRHLHYIEQTIALRSQTGETSEVTDRQEVLLEYVSDMLEVEKHTLESIERQTLDDRVRSYGEAYKLLMRIELTLRNHTTVLEHYLKSTGGGGAGALMKKAATAAVGAMAGLYGKIRPEDPVSRDLRDDYTALNLAAISYTMLHTTAIALAESRLADLALSHLTELTPLIAALSKVIPPVVAMELSVEGKAMYPAAGAEAVASTQKAWSREVIG